MTTTPFRQIVRRVPLRGGGKARAEVSRHNHSRILTFCSSCETIPERPFWADSVPVGVRRRILHRCHLAPAMYCRHQHSCSSTIPFTRRQILTSHSVHLPVCRAQARDAGRHPPVQYPQTRMSHPCACDSSPFAGAPVGHVRRKERYDPLDIIGEKTQRTARRLAMAVQMNTTPRILFTTKFHVACQIHQPSISILLMVSSQPGAVVRNEFTHFGLLWAECLSTHRSSCRPKTANVGGRRGTLRKDLTNCSQDAILR